MEQGIHITLRSGFATSKVGLPGRTWGDMSGKVSWKSDFVVVLLSPISGIESSLVFDMIGDARAERAWMLMLQ